ncbi:MAG: polyphosphate kinase 2 [Alphaproteobacteria bacterium]|nr:polyphosphate kinase 2 [Alphaproteobacteria bacterium]
MKRERYEEELQALQVELVKMLDWTRKSGQRIVIVFEGRDAAGKGGAIKRMTEHLNPRYARIVALSKPTEQERGQWYFQRYINHLLTRGEISIFDRSWYNRAGVEPVFGFCTPQETDMFLAEAPAFEAMLSRDGKVLVKFFLTIGSEMQTLRLHERWHDPLARWKLSDLDFKAMEKWDQYSHAYERMLSATDAPQTPWTIVRANDKRRSRLECIRHVLNMLPYAGKDEKLTAHTDRKIVLSAREFLKSGGES